MKPALASAMAVVRDGKDAAAVRAAIMDLGYQKDKAVLPVLIDKLNDANPGVQHAAVVALGRLGWSEAIDELVKAKIFRSPAANVRWAAVAAVGRLGDFRVIDHLLKAVEDAEWIVRTQAATELKSKVQDIIARKDVRLARILVHMLSLESEEIVSLAIDGFQELGGDCRPLLHEALNNSSAVIRANAAQALGRLKSRQSTPFLTELLQDESWQVRARAAAALGAIGDKAGIEPLVLKLEDNVGRVREAAGIALAQFGRAATIPLLNALARETDKFALRAMLSVIGRVGDPKSAPALIGYLRSSYYIVRQAALTALVRFGPAVVDLLIPTISFHRGNVARLKKDAGDKSRPDLQIRAIKALGGLEEHRAVAVLKKSVEQGLPEVREAATAALALIGCAAWGRCCALKVLAEAGGPELVPRLVPSLDDDSDNVRLEAVRALGKLGGPEAVPALIRAAVGDRNECVRWEAVCLLRTVGAGQPGVLEAGLRGLKDRSREVRSQSAALLGIFHDRKSIPPLLKAMADHHWSVRESAENALLNFGRAAVAPLIEALRSPSWTTRFRAARLLGEIGDAAAVSPLQRLLTRPSENKEVRAVADAALRKLNHIQSN